MAIPLHRCHAILISPPPPESISTNVGLPPPPTQAASSTAPIIPPILPAPVTSAPGSASSTQKKQRKQLKPAKKVASTPPLSELPFPPSVPYACNYACGPKLREWCAKDRPPIGHKNPIPNFIVSTIIRHAMPHRFESLEEIKEREIATGVADRPKDREVGERDGNDVEYGPPAWDSDKARPKKSCFRNRESARFAPYPNPATRTPLIRRLTEDIKASLDEALANRIQPNYEGPIAISIRNEISAIHIPDGESFKWEPHRHPKLCATFITLAVEPPSIQCHLRATWRRRYKKTSKTRLLWSGSYYKVEARNVDTRKITTTLLSTLP